MSIYDLNAYEVLQTEDLSDLKSKGTLLKHKKSGARVLLMENDDENKVFTIGFRTPPSDSTGVPHIMEHSVLCGSKEFPVKDPFVELVKGSLNTFLNAMTYPDKTVYPVASCNDKDFQNLMHVYMDAVFYPNIYQNDKTFRQEGWSYKLDDPDGELTISGVVYNEMKGAFSSPEGVLDRVVLNSLFPDNAYSVESGGDPEVIPELTYEQFLDFHRKYYHPSNSYIYLYGDMNMEEKLRWLDEKYLSDFENEPVDSEIHLQKPFTEMKEVVQEYSIASEESEEDNTYLSYNKVIGTTLDEKLYLAFEILDYALLSAPGAPLKKALLDAQIGKDIYGSYDDGVLQPFFSIVAKGAKTSQKEEFVSTIRKCLQDIVENGVDKKAILAGINYMEFRYREADFGSYPKGLMYGLDILGNWLYDDENPFAQVKLLAIYDRLKEAVNEGYFEEIIRKWLLDNTHGTILTLIPKRGLAAKREKDLEEMLEKYRSSLSDAELEELVRKTKALEAYQESEENPEDLECIPMLKRSDIRREVEGFSNEELAVDDSLFLYQDVCTNGIGYVNVMFEIRDMEVEKVHYLGLLKSVLGYVDTKDYTYGQLFNEINARTGGIQCGVDVFDKANDPEVFRTMFTIRGKALYSQMDFLFQMMGEILNTSRLTDTKRLREIIGELKSRGQASLIGAGHQTAVLRGSSYASPMAKFQDEMAGVGYYKFVEDLDKNFQEKKEEIVAGLLNAVEEIIRPDSFMVSYTGERESVEQIQKLCGELKKSLPQRTSQVPSVSITCEKKNEGFKTSGQVQYVAKCGNFVKKGYAYTGALEILKVALSYDYLWINLRVKGGAYGCMSGFRRSGESYFVSYRDPHLRRTLEVYQGVPEYVRTFQADERELTKYIIGTISGKDVPRTPQSQGALGRMAYFRGLTVEMLQKERDQILDATVEDIHALAPLIEAILADDQICVVGSESAVEKAKDVFMETKPLVSC